MTSPILHVKQPRRKEAEDLSEATQLTSRIPSPSRGIGPRKSAFFLFNLSCFMSSCVAGVPSMWKALKKLQSHFEISWQKIECHPKHSLGFKHLCQSWLSSPGDFYPNNRSLWCAWPEGPWAVIMSKIWIYWVMQINKKETGSLRLFHYCLLCCQPHGPLRAKHLPSYHFNNLCNGDERAWAFRGADILIIPMLIISEPIRDWGGSSKVQRRFAVRLGKCRMPRLQKNPRWQNRDTHVWH